MILQDIYHYDHKLNALPHSVWALYVVPAFVLALLSHSLVFNGILIVLYIVLSIKLARARAIQLFRLYKIPLLFIFMGSLTVAVSFQSSDSLFSVKGLSIGFGKENLMLAVETLFRSLAVISIVFFALLTRTISEIAEIMHACYVPNIIIELFILTYKFISNLGDIITRMIIAQKSRLAYTRRGNKFHSLTNLFSAVFRRSVAKSMQLDMVMQARMGSGNFYFVSRRKLLKNRQVLEPLLLSSGLLMCFIIFQIYG